MPIRKNQRNLTQNEKRRFVAALKELKASGVYDRYVKIHWQAMMGRPMMGMPDPAHGGPAFLARQNRPGIATILAAWRSAATPGTRSAAARATGTSRGPSPAT